MRASSAALGCSGLGDPDSLRPEDEEEEDDDDDEELLELTADSEDDEGGGGSDGCVDFLPILEEETQVRRKERWSKLWVGNRRARARGESALWPIVISGLHTASTDRNTEMSAKSTPDRLSEKQESRLIIHLESEFLQLTRAYEGRHSDKSTMPTISHFLDAVSSEQCCMR